MSFWQELGEVLARLAAGGQALIDRISDAISELRANRRSVAFTVAIIALSAKMAKADGVVTASEVRAFEKLCTIPQGEEGNVRRLFNLAKEDVAGFDVYAERMARLLDYDAAILEVVMDGLFSIAKADGIIHENELSFLRIVAARFGFDRLRFETIVDRHVERRDDPYRILGISRTASLEEIRAKRRDLMREHHPDRLMARGVPAEFIRIATDKMAAVNAAYDDIMREKAAP